MIRLALPLAAAVACALAGAPAASAGTYTVNACSVGERVNPNLLLTAKQTTAGAVFDTTCGTGNPFVQIGVLKGGKLADDSSATLGFTAPAGMTIASFSGRVRLLVDNTDTPGHNPFVTGALGSTVFAGAGNEVASVRKPLAAQGAWFGYPSNAGDSGTIAISSTSLKALAGYGGTATSLDFRLACRRLGSVCDIDPARNGGIARIFGLSITLNDPTPPVLQAAASGLLAGGSPAGSAPVTVDASDGSGIRAVVLIDSTNPAAPEIVGGKSFDPADPGYVRSVKGDQCSDARAHSCPDLTNEPITPTALKSGVRQIVVRAIDRAGNAADAGPYRVDVSTPSDRGALNGAGATDAAKLTAGFTTTKKGSRTVDYKSRPTIKGTLTNDAGAPITGARLTVYTRDTNAESYRRRGTLTTGDKGGYRFRAKAPNSRYVRVVWVSHVNDTRTAATDAVKVRVRASASLSAPRAVRVGRRFTLRGRLRGISRTRGVSLVAEAYEQGRYRTFKLGRTGKGGRFKLTDSFRSAGSRGRTFRMRVRILGRTGYPYTSGTTRTVKVRVR